MLILSWNVAGLSTTINRIHDSCPSNRQISPESNSTSAKPKKSTTSNTCTALATFLQQHGNVDIFCVQEHKIPRTQLSNRCEPRHVSHVPGYESFWSCCVDDNSKGMFGVCFFVCFGFVFSV